MNRYCIIGRNGLIGKALERKLGKANVDSYPTKHTNFIYDFGSYVHPVFEENPEYFMSVEMHRFQLLLRHCSETGAMLVYPSSALVYENNSTFARFKLALEATANSSKAKTLGLRIFPVYGPGEFRTVITHWIDDMIHDRSPIVFGDGEQTRDFIYITDVVEQILSHTLYTPPWHNVIDIGSGKQTKFNDIIATINKTLGKNIKPEYIDRPKNYSEGYECPGPVPTRVTIEDGIRKIILER